MISRESHRLRDTSSPRPLRRLPPVGPGAHVRLFDVPEDRITVLYAIDAHSDPDAAIGWGNTTDQYERWVAFRREFADELLAHARSLADGVGVTLDTVVVGSTDRDAFRSYVVADDVTQIVNTAPVPVVVV